jgi:polysaccharide deacetylase family protein (PEP-CTERM system associated)
MNGAPGAKVANVLTVDVEDYYHVSAFDGVLPRSAWQSLESRVCANTHRLLDIFDEFGVRGTFFVLGLVGEQHPQLVRDIAGRGHEIASHGYAHRLVYDQTPRQFAEDVRKAKALLEDACGCEVAGYRAPSYSITPRSLWAIDVLLQQGYRYDASIFPIRHDRYGIPVSERHPYAIRRGGGTMMEVPGSTTRIGPINLPIAGGGYFRLLPYGWTRWGINRVNQREGRPAVFYLHPWEIDPGQPRLTIGRLGTLRHYRNLGETERRLRMLLAEFRFGPMDALLADSRRDVGLGVEAAQLPYCW